MELEELAEIVLQRLVVYESEERLERKYILLKDVLSTVLARMVLQGRKDG